MFSRCPPEWWYQPNGTCPGSSFLGLTTVPDVNDPRVLISSLTVYINVFYSLTPILVLIASMSYVLWLWLDERNHRLQKDKLQKKIANSQLALKYTFLSLVLVLLNCVQKLVIHLAVPDCSWVRRPVGSCLLGSGMPDEWSLWSAALLASMSIDSLLRWSVPFLTEDGSQHQCYSKQEMDLLGYTAIKAQDMVKTIVSLLVVLGPVPLSRIIVQDSTYWQMIAGILEGVVLGIVFHVWRVKLLDSEREEQLHHFLTHRMIRGGYVRCLFAEEVRRARDGEGGWPGRFKALVAERWPQAWHEATEKTRQRLEELAGGEAGAPLLEAGEARRGSPGDAQSESLRRVRANRQKNFWNLRPSDLPGFEFMQIKVADYVGILRKQAEELKRQQEQELAETRERHRRETEEQEERLRAESRAKLEKLQSEAEEEIRRRREEMRRQQERFHQYQEKLDSTADVLQQLQTAIDDGDIMKLGSGLRSESIQPYLEDDGNEKDDSEDAKIRLLFKPVAHQAMSTYNAWVAARDKFKAELQNAEAFIEKRKSDGAPLEDLVLDGKVVRSLFNALVACVEKGLALDKADEDRRRCGRVEELLHAYAEREFTFCSKERKDNVHKDIITKAVTAQTRERLGNFDATDLETCLQTVDRKEEKFRKLAQVQVGRVFETTTDREGRPRTRPVSALTGCLQQLSTLIFFLDYLNKENLDKTYRMFDERLTMFKAVSAGEEEFKEKIKGWIAAAREDYQADMTLLQREDLEDLQKEDTDVNMIITKMEQRELPGMDVFKDIFCKLARVWEKDFGVLVVPHHTQVVALLVFKAFLNGDDAELKTLIGQVSTGEGKSMLIASLALFVVSQTDRSRRKRVHVVGTDEKLVQRDFESFRGVFEEWRQQHLQDLPEDEARSFAVVCAKKAGGSPHARTAIPDEAWIVYCEAKHVSSYYTQKAREGRLDAKLYQERVLIIDEVDALIVDKDPTDEFVYDISERAVETKGGRPTIKQYAKDVVTALKEGRSTDGLLPSDPTSTSLFRDLSKLVKQVQAWKACPDDRYKDEFGNWYGTDKNGRVNKDYKSNFLEVLRFVDKKEPEMCWYERLYVMSVPRVFKLYSRIIGFSGTVGNRMEQEFLAKAYGAHFFIVPPFLQTCQVLEEDGKTERELYHVAEWAARSVWNTTLGGPALVCGSEEEQMDKVAALAFEARKKVPVLVIAKEDEQVKTLQERLENVARNQKLVADDVVRPLSASLFGRDPKQYKENLRLSTRFYSRHGEDKQWRITLTDPSGARGTDYRMDDDRADMLGGLLLIIMEVPLSERDWIQYKGRTARQNWRGQYCAILNAQDYKNERSIAQDIVDAVNKSPSIQTSDALVEAILDVGLRKSATDLANVQAVYNAGFVANEVCEGVWTSFKKEGTVDVALDEKGRNSFVKLCKMYRYWSYGEIMSEAGLISSELFPPGFRSGVPDQDYTPEPLPTPPKMVVFMYDVSYSMRGAVGPTTRMGACRAQLESMMQDPSIIGDHDHVGVVAFGYGLRYLLEPEPGVRSRLPGLMQGPLGDAEAGLVSCQQQLPQKLTLKHQADPGNWPLGKSTHFFFALESLLDDLLQKGGEALKGSLWLIALTDGEPSDAEAKEGAAKAKLRQYCEASNNLIIITVSGEVGESEEKFQGLVSTVQQGGGNGIYIAAKDVTDDSAIKQAFSNVKAALIEVGGTTEA